MRTYGQFCPIARASEIVAERWTPIIIRNMMLGCITFNAIADGAPGLSRGLLSTRLRELARAGVIEIRAKEDHHGSTYRLTEAGRELSKVLIALQHWGSRNGRSSHREHAHPGVVLWAWVGSYLRLRSATPTAAHRPSGSITPRCAALARRVVAGRTRQRRSCETPPRRRRPSRLRTRTARLRTVAPRRDRVARHAALRSDRGDRPPRPGARTTQLAPLRRPSTTHHRRRGRRSAGRLTQSPYILQWRTPALRLSCTSYASSATARANSAGPSAWYSTVPRYHPSVANHSPPSSASPKPSTSTTRTPASCGSGEHRVGGGVVDLPE